MRIPERLMQKTRVSALGCWEWLARKDRFGYGRVNSGGQMVLAHRAAYNAFIGEIPKGKCVLHSCDNPSCINPSHLFLGTQQSNATDKAMKNRGVKSKIGNPFGVNRSGKKWTARCRIRGTLYCLGSYASANEASRVAAEFKDRHSCG